MKIYLAARYSRRDELRKIRDELQSLGIEVTSRWLDTEWERQTDHQSSAAPPEYREKYALIDMEDLYKATTVIAFTEPPESPASRGGRHTEFGMAIAWNKRLIVVGHRENLFYHLPKVEFYTNTETMMNDLWRQPK